MTKPKTKSYQIFNQIYFARVVAYLLILACIVFSISPMYSNRLTLVTIGVILVTVPHVIYLVHRKTTTTGLKLHFEKIEYRGVYIDNIICGFCIPLCFYYPATVFVLAIVSYANLITIGGLGLWKKAWFLLPLGIVLGYLLGSRLYSSDHNPLLLSASGALLGIHMMSVVYINYFNTLKMNKVKENLKHSLEDLGLEKEHSERLLLNILPEDIAHELRTKGEVDPKRHETVTVLFTDFKEFTQKSESHTAHDLVKEIHNCFKVFDEICEKYKVEKIKTIGDSYMVAGGLKSQHQGSSKNVVLAALEMTDFIVHRSNEKSSTTDISFEMRVGIHTGPVVAGIVGIKKFQYDLWGDTVNTASRMESHGEIGQVNISQNTYELIKNDKQFSFQHRGKVHAKGKGEIDMYFVSWS